MGLWNDTTILANILAVPKKISTAQSMSCIAIALLWIHVRGKVLELCLHRIYIWIFIMTLSSIASNGENSDVFQQMNPWTHCGSIHIIEYYSFMKRSVPVIDGQPGWIYRELWWVEKLMPNAIIAHSVISYIHR